MSKKGKFFIGTSGWTYADWQGVFYPEAWPKRRWLEYYATQLNTVEINATFYRFFKDQTYQKWYGEVPDQFRFVLKAPQLITHRKYLKDCGDSIKRFYRSASQLQDKLGLILLQLSPHMPYHLNRLKDALSLFDKSNKVAVEFRHPKWLTQAVKELLCEFHSVFCIVDSPDPTLFKKWVTADIAYIRLHGRKTWYASNYSKNELKEIAHLAKQLSSLGAKEIYIFFNNDYHSFATKNALYLKELLA